MPAKPLPPFFVDTCFCGQDFYRAIPFLLSLDPDDYVQIDVTFEVNIGDEMNRHILALNLDLRADDARSSISMSVKRYLPPCDSAEYTDSFDSCESFEDCESLMSLAIRAIPRFCISPPACSSDSEDSEDSFPTSSSDGSSLEIESSSESTKGPSSEVRLSVRKRRSDASPFSSYLKFDPMLIDGRSRHPYYFNDKPWLLRKLKK